jgi:hypothetical protein
MESKNMCFRSQIALKKFGQYPRFKIKTKIKHKIILILLLISKIANLLHIFQNFLQSYISKTLNICTLISFSYTTKIF